MTIKSFRDLIVWQKAMDFVVEVYRATATFQKDEQFGLTSQLRRCSVSIPSNIAEGHGRFSPADFARFLTIAHGSLTELDTHLEFARRRSYLSDEEWKRLSSTAGELGRMIRAFRASLRRR